MGITHNVRTRDQTEPHLQCKIDIWIYLHFTLSDAHESYAFSFKCHHSEKCIVFSVVSIPQSHLVGHRLRNKHTAALNSYYLVIKYANNIIIKPPYKSAIFLLAATKQLYECFSPSVRPSVCLSVCPSVTPFWLCSHQRIIMKFSGIITNDKSDVHAKGQGQRSKVKVTEVTTQLNRFRTVTPVWIQMWWWNDAYGLMMLRRGALLLLKVIRQFSRSHGSKKRRIWPRFGVSGL